MCDNAVDNENIVAITAAMSYGTGLEPFHKKFPQRFFDVGIAEAHALTFAAGLAAAGKKTVVAIYSTFLQRGFDSIIHDIALQNLPVIMCIDRAGLNSGDGPTHHGIFDVAFLSGLPNVRIYTPATYSSLRFAINEALILDQPCAIRYPSGQECDIIYKEFDTTESAVKLQKNASANCKVMIISHGRMVETALQVVNLLKEQGIQASAIMLERLTPYNEIAARILEILPLSVKRIVTLEEEIRAGGMGMMLYDALIGAGIDTAIKVDVIAADDPFVRCKQNMTYRSMLGLDAESIANTICSNL